MVAIAGSGKHLRIVVRWGSSSAPAGSLAPIGQLSVASDLFVFRSLYLAASHLVHCVFPGIMVERSCF